MCPLCLSLQNVMLLSARGPSSISHSVKHIATKSVSSGYRVRGRQKKNRVSGHTVIRKSQKEQTRNLAPICVDKSLVVNLL